MYQTRKTKLGKLRETLGKTDDASDRELSVSPFFLQLKRDFWSFNRKPAHLLEDERNNPLDFCSIQKEFPWSLRSP